MGGRDGSYDIMLHFPLVSVRTDSLKLPYSISRLNKAARIRKGQKPWFETFSVVPPGKKRKGGKRYLQNMHVCRAKPP